jgi:hypothetical protein
LLAVSNPPLSGHQYLFCASPRQEKEYLQQTATNLPRKKGFLFAREIVFTNLSGGNSSEVKSSTLHLF